MTKPRGSRLRRMLAGALGLVSLFSLQAACNNDCDFFERCVGNTLQICGDGPDQTFNRKIHSKLCEAPNSICVERDEDHSECILPSRTACADSFQRRCEGDVLIACSPELGYSDASNEPPRYEIAVPCEDDGDRRCVDYGDDASCVE